MDLGTRLAFQIDFMGESGVNQLRVIMNNHNGGYLETMALIIIFQAIDVVTVHSISPIMYKHMSVDGCIPPLNHS